MNIPFNKPYMVGKELWNIAQANVNGHMAGDGPFSMRCHAWLEERTGSLKALLTHSCTGALEMAGILANVGPGDEVIMASYTFVSTANAFVIRGAVPVFVDIRPDTLNIDESRIEGAITEKTKAIVAVHYAGVACDMDVIIEIANKYNLLVIEDAAQGVMAAYKSRPLGAIGHLGALSFHETKNIIAGEGGALLVNDPRFLQRADIIREKGTNRSQFFRGEVDKYTWVDIGSSYLPSELVAAFLSAQMDEANAITDRRMSIWNTYHEAFEPLSQRGLVRRPIVPDECQHNAHMYYLLLPDLDSRDRFIAALKQRGIHAVFHYVPLHDSPAGLRFGRAHGDFKQTVTLSGRLVRLPLWVGIESQLSDVIASIIETIEEIGR